MIRPDVDCQNL